MKSSELEIRGNHMAPAICVLAIISFIILALFLWNEDKKEKEIFNQIVTVETTILEKKEVVNQQNSQYTLTVNFNDKQEKIPVDQSVYNQYEIGDSIKISKHKEEIEILTNK